jgi:dynein light chain Tctex-type 1
MSLLQNQFIVDEVSNVIKQAIEQTIGGNAYQHDKVNNWTGAVVENCLSVLTKQQKPYKYIGESSSLYMLRISFISFSYSYFCFYILFTVTCMIMQKNGAGLHTASSCYWNNDTDGSCTVRWENKSMYCICRYKIIKFKISCNYNFIIFLTFSVFGLAI